MLKINHVVSNTQVAYELNAFLQATVHNFPYLTFFKLYTDALIVAIGQISLVKLIFEHSVLATDALVKMYKF